MKTRNTPIALLVAAMFLAAGCSNSVKPPEPPAPNMAPQLTAIANVSVDQDTLVGPVQFGISDDLTPANQLTVTAAVDSGSPLPTDAVILTGDGATRSITLKPLEAATGMAIVTVSVIDASGLKATRSFSVTVNARAASVKDAVAATFSKGEADEPTALNGLTFTQDADDPAAFAGLVGDP